MDNQQVDYTTGAILPVDLLHLTLLVFAFSAADFILHICICWLDTELSKLCEVKRLHSYLIYVIYEWMNPYTAEIWLVGWLRFNGAC